MVSISCFFNHYNHVPVKIIFVQYDDLFKIYLNDRVVVINTEMLLSNLKLFQIYILSLVCTEDTSVVEINEYNCYSISTQKYWKYLRFTDYFELTELVNWKKNPLKARKPIRVSSSKKIRKFEKEFNHFMSSRIKDPIVLFEEYYDVMTSDETDIVSEYETYKNTLAMHALFMHQFGCDMYASIQKHL